MSSVVELKLMYLYVEFVLVVFGYFLDSAFALSMMNWRTEWKYTQNLIYQFGPEWSNKPTEFNISKLWLLSFSQFYI